MELLTASQIAERLRFQRPNVTEARVRAALEGVNQDAIYDAQRSPWSVEVWDRTSPINGVDAQHFLSRPDVPAEGEVYLLKRDGVVVIFQPHDPARPGLAPMANAAATGTGHADGIAHENAVGQLLATVLARLPA